MTKILFVCHGKAEKERENSAQIHQSNSLGNYKQICD